MAAPKRHNKINLIIKEGLAATTSGRILAWILSTFRIIVIITELIVMIAFLSRFWLDAQNTDLAEEIEQKQGIIASLSDFEKEFKLTQTKLKIFSDLTAREGLANNAVKTISSNLPPDIFLQSLAFYRNTIYIEGTSPSEISIQQLIVNLDSKDLFESANLIEMGTSPFDPSLLKFKLNITIESKEKT